MSSAILAIPRVLTTLRVLLLNDPQLVARLATTPPTLGGGPAIYTEGVVPAAASQPYLSIGPFTERSESTMGTQARWGSALTTQIKLVTASADVSVNMQTLDRLVALLHNVPLTVADYEHGWCALELIADAYEEKYAGMVAWHYPTLWAIHVGQPR